MTSISSNPLLSSETLPKYATIASEHVLPAVEYIVKQITASFEHLEENAEAAWDSLMTPFDKIDRALNRVWGPIGHLNAVKNSDDLRQAYESALPQIVSLSLRLAQSEKVYAKLKEITCSSQWIELSATKRRAIELAIRSAELSGIALTGNKRTRFNELATRLSELETKFENNVLDATKAFCLVLTHKSDLDGLPESYLEMASQTYNRKNIKDAGNPASCTGTTIAASTPTDGPWAITLDMPSYLPFMEHARKRNLRENLWKAHATRASEGEKNNQPLILEILMLRKELAQLLGYQNWAQRSLAEKMAESVSSVFELLTEVRAPARKRALNNLEELKTLAKEGGQTEPFQIWDTWFWRARLQEKQLQFNDEILRPYFPLPHVMQGLFQLVERLFGVTLTSADGTAEVWNSDVHFYHAKDENGEHIASLYFDPYSRPENKRGGAWMNICNSRRMLDGELEIPVTYICCNNAPPIGNKPSLLSFGEVTTLFHEMGHALQHMLTRVDIGQVSGISGVEWDAEELASQFMENWCYDAPTLKSISKHHQTGEHLPDTFIDKIQRYRVFASGLAMVRQLAFAESDMVLHSQFDPTSGQNPLELYKQVGERNLVLAMPPEDRSLCAFSHIFSSSYAAGYYSYLWAEVLSADAFAAFEEVGMDNEAELRNTGRRYRETFLALGGSRHPQEVFREFRGRSPKTEALLRHRGLMIKE